MPHDGQGLNLGTVTTRAGEAPTHTGFDGYYFGFVDEDGDGVNDLFVDADGDGINDRTGHGYIMGFGHVGDGGDTRGPVDWLHEPPMHDGGPMMQ